MNAGTEQNVSNRRRLRWWHVALLGYVLAYAWWYWPFINPRWDQDRCAFGTVSNQQYREMLARLRPAADAVPPGSHKRVPWHEPHLFQDYLRDAAARARSNDELVALVHAAMRALGAWHTGRRWSPPNHRHLRYQIHQGRMDRWPPLALRALLYVTGPLTAFVGFPWAQVTIWFDRDGSNNRLSVKVVRSGVITWNIKGTNFWYFKRSIEGGCPQSGPLLK